MSTYMLLQDMYISNQILQAGTVQSTADIGGVLPTNWVPNPNVDPLDGAAVNAFYAAGPSQPGLIRSLLAVPGINITKPVTRWQSTSINPWSTEFSSEFGGEVRQWQLTGLGSGLPPIIGALL